MLASAVAGAVGTFTNMRSVLGSTATSLGLVAAGEGATLVCALVLLSVTLLGQSAPALVRAGLWVLPLTGSATGVAISPDTVHSVVMAVTPLAMAVSGEGLAFVARRVVAYQTGSDPEALRTAGLLAWHASRTRRGNRLQRVLSRRSVWSLTRKLAQADTALSASYGQAQSAHLIASAGEDMAFFLGLETGPATPAVAPVAAPATPAVAPVAAGVAPQVSPATPAVGTPSAHHLTAAAPATPSVPNSPAALAVAGSILPMTVADVASAKGVSPATVRSWKHRGRLTPMGTDANGRDVFHPAHVAAL
jgi:hypothetical protein